MDGHGAGLGCDGRLGPGFGRRGAGAEEEAGKQQNGGLVHKVTFPLTGAGS